MKLTKSIGLGCLLLIGACAGGHVHSTHFPFGGLWSVRNYQAGVPQRAWLTFHPNKAIATESFFADGRRTGTWNTSSARGVLLFQRSYADDVPHGEWKRYDQKGNLIVMRRFEKGQLVETHWASER